MTKKNLYEELVEKAQPKVVSDPVEAKELNIPMWEDYPLFSKTKERIEKGEPTFDFTLKFSDVWTAVPTPAVVKKQIDYIFDEENILKEALDHINSTYGQHYSGQTQPTELIIDSGHGIGFTVGNIIKYAARLGKKDGWNKKDVYKIIHYAVILANIMNTRNSE